MNKKKTLSAVAVALCVASLAGCTDVNKKITFGEYWKKTASVNEKVLETLKYEVTFEKSTGLESLGYELSYATGSYVATLECPENTNVYTYTTELSVPVTYKLGDATETFEDKVLSIVTFVGNYSDKVSDLRPLSAKKEVVSHSPTTATPTKLSDCYTAFEYEMETTYAENGTGKSTVVYNPTSEQPTTQSSNFEYGKDDYTYLDNEQLLLALRAIPAGTSSGSFEVYNPYNKVAQKIDFSFASSEAETLSYTLNGTAVTNKSTPLRVASLSIDDKNPGGTQTVKIATAAADRNILVSLSTPLSYSIGSLNYTLKEITRA